MQWGTEFIISRLQKILTKPISHAMGHKADKSHFTCYGAQNLNIKNFNIKASKNTGKSHFTCNGAQNFNIKAYKTLTNPITRAMGHRIYNIKASKTLTNPISHAMGHRIYNIKASNNTDRSHFT